MVTVIDMNTDFKNRRNVPILFCNFKGPDEQKLSCVLPFNNGNKNEAHIETLSEWYRIIDDNVEICGSQSEIMTACSWYDNEAFDFSVHDDYFIISKEKRIQAQHDSSVWIVCAKECCGGSHYHIEQMDCHDTLEDLIAVVDMDHAYICETAEVADELMSRLCSI